MRTIQARGFAVAMGVGLLGTLAFGALAQEASKPAAAQTSATPAQATATPAISPDLTGDWRLDPAHSDMPPSGGGGGEHGEHGGGGGGGGWGGHHGGGGGGGYGGHHGGSGSQGANTASGGGGGGGGRNARLPALIHITQTPTLVSFEDSTGVVLQEIATVAAVADTMTRAPGALHVSGTWTGGTLTVAHEGPRGKVKETWQLEKSGAALDQVVAFESEQMGARTMKRVYRRVEEP